MVVSTPTWACDAAKEYTERAFQAESLEDIIFDLEKIQDSEKGKNKKTREVIFGNYWEAHVSRIRLIGILAMEISWHRLKMHELESKIGKCK